jgi:hypothetical protein
LVIQIDLTNKSIPHAYVDQADTHEEFMKTGINQVKYYHAIIAKAPILNLKYKHDQGFNLALLKGLVTHEIDANHLHKINKGKE